jgi:hypothetical protein
MLLIAAVNKRKIMKTDYSNMSVEELGEQLEELQQATSTLKEAIKNKTKLVKKQQAAAIDPEDLASLREAFKKPSVERKISIPTELVIVTGPSCDWFDEADSYFDSPDWLTCEIYPGDVELPPEINKQLDIDKIDVESHLSKWKVSRRAAYFSFQEKYGLDPKDYIDSDVIDYIDLP